VRATNRAHGRTRGFSSVVVRRGSRDVILDLFSPGGCFVHEVFVELDGETKCLYKGS
jgi:hypothetical protein